MEDHLQNHHHRSFPGCMKGLTHFLDLHHHLHLRKMKMLTYRRNGEGKRAARNKEPKTDPDVPSASQEYFSSEDGCFMVEEKVNDTRKRSMKLSIRISFPKWRSREHNNKKVKVSPTPSKLLRTPSISENHAENVISNIRTSIIKQIEEDNQASSIIERVYKLHGTDDEHNIEKQCDENMTCSDELERIFHKVASFAQRDTDAKELQGDATMYPSKEFIDMMKLFNGNIELIQKILEDPSFIFAHYLQGQRASYSQLRRNHSFPTPNELERVNGGSLGIKHKRFECESLIQQSGNFHAGNTLSDPHIVKNNAPKTEMIADDLAAPSSILQKAMENPSSFCHFKLIKYRIKDIIKDNKKGYHNHISMDGILHKIPHGRKVLEDINKSKPGQRVGSVVEKLARESWRYKSSKPVEKSIERSQSLNESLSKYSHLYDSITKGEFKGLPERQMLVKANAKTLGRVFSLSDIKDCSSSKIVQFEDHHRPSPRNLTTLFIEESLRKEESEEFLTGESSKLTVVNCENISSLNNEHTQCEFSNKLATEIVITEGSDVILTQEHKLMDEIYIQESSKSAPISTTWSFDLDDDSLSFLDFAVPKDEHECKEVYPKRPKSSPDTDFFDLLLLGIERKHDAEFNYVREILRRSGFIGNDFLGAWHNPYQPLNPSVLKEAEGFEYEGDVTEDEHDMLERRLLFDMANEALVEMCEASFGYYFPWLSHFSTDVRPVPVGNHILERVWAAVRWHLDGRSRFDKTLNEIIARDFMKNDRWMDVRFDIEDVGLEVECLVLDDVLDEVVIQLSDLIGFKSIPS